MRESAGDKVSRFVAPGDVVQRKLHVGRRYVTNLIDFWRVSKKREAES
jgi:hypothetical protein